MSNKNTTAGGRLTVRNLWRVRFTFVGYFALLLTFCAPISPLQNPPLSLQSAEAQPTDLKQIARLQSVTVYGWKKHDVKCLNQLWGKESAWNPLADNPHSTAFGIAQMLNEKSKDPVVQISNGLRYIKHRYNTPCNAWSHWRKKNYY